MSQDTLTLWKSGFEANGPKRPKKGKTDLGGVPSSSRRGSRRLRRHPIPKKSLLSSQDSYRAWMAELQKKHQKLKSEKAGAPLTFHKSTPQSKGAARLKMFRKKYFEQPTTEQVEGRSKELAHFSSSEQNTAIKTQTRDIGRPIIEKLKQSEPRAATTAKISSGKIEQATPDTKTESKHQLSLEPTVYSTAQLQHQDWLQRQHVDLLENYPVLSPRSNADEKSVGDISFIEEALNDIARTSSLQDSSQDYNRSINHKERIRIEKLVKDVAQKISKSYRIALQNEKNMHEDELNALKQSYETELKSLVTAYNEKLSYYIRRTQHTQQAEVAVRELVEINSRILRNGKGNQVAPAHIRKKLESWDKRNRSIFNEGSQSNANEMPKSENLNQQLDDEIAKETVKVKPWTPNYNSSRANARSAVDGMGKGTKGQNSATEDNPINITMLEALRKQNEDIRKAEESTRLKLESAEVSICAKNEEIKSILKRYAEMEAKYKAAMKEVRLLEYYGGRGRR